MKQSELVIGNDSGGEGLDWSAKRVMSLSGPYGLTNGTLNRRYATAESKD